MADNSVSKNARFRAELVPRRETWFAIMVLALLAMAVMLSFGNFILNFRSMTDAQDRVILFEAQEMAIIRVADDLELNAAADRLSDSLDRYAQSADQIAGLRMAGPSNARDGSSGDSRSGQLVALASGRRDAEFRDLVARLGDDAARDADLARGNFAAEYRDTVRAILILGGVIVVALFGGLWMFLRRSLRLQELLKSRTADLEEVDRSRRLFFAKASHELRTPVTTMQGEAEVALADSGTDIEAMRESLEHVVAHAGFLGHRIEEMIGLARTADGQLHLEMDPLDLRSIVTAAIEDAQIYADSVNVAISVTAPSANIGMTGDSLWLRRALLAIIENALKFSPMGGAVDIAVEVDAGSARIAVTDQGPGVSPDELPLIFDAYYQTDVGKQRGGSGLGLAMARWVIEQHGGSAAARNIGNLRRRGCRVTVTVPIGRSR
ncbi:HAMP domain-containing histidine kinase [Parasphingopyxis sp. CP4]|uniref:sensor histidine kinase n=1 Tax=Parasphingopyxis sp. CP4 TaxID=2724527 RepID=UPI0015A23D1B|nr:HAMP domain-containing sensor histidine kinase [Parasphingopyxis sp. CP4]QLC22424.1 HAMP domain-containing histidine kinase [Parasphingopyxis sp. CP4]